MMCSLGEWAWKEPWSQGFRVVMVGGMNDSSGQPMHVLEGHPKEYNSSLGVMGNYGR